MLEYLDIVVGESYSAAPECGEDEQLYVDVAEVAHQQGGGEEGNQYDYTSHRRGTLLLHLSGKAEVADAFAYLLALEPADNPAAGEESDEHTNDYGRHGPEAQVGHEPHSGEVDILKMCE